MNFFLIQNFINSQKDDSVIQCVTFGDALAAYNSFNYGHKNNRTDEVSLNFKNDLLHNYSSE